MKIYAEVNLVTLLRLVKFTELNISEFWFLNFQACDWKKDLKLNANLKKAYFSDIAQKKWLTSLEAQISAFFRVKDHKRLVLNTIFCCFWDFWNIFNHITGV